MRKRPSACNAVIFLKAFIIIPICISAICLQKSDAQESEKHYKKMKKKAEVFAKVGGSLHGIVFDDNNNMYVGKKGKEILKISSKGEISPFVEIKEALGYYRNGPGDTFIYDMEIGKDHHLYVAAEDRVLKISPDGKVDIFLKYDFTGEWGACSVALDNVGNVYVSFDTKVLKIEPSGEKSIFIDSKKIGVKLDAVVGIEFDHLYKYLYVCDGLRGGTGQLIQVPIRTDGTPGKGKVIFKKEGYRPEYVCINAENDIVTKGPENGDFVFIKSDLTPLIIELGDTGPGEIETIAFGKKGFKRNSIYGTEWFTGIVYRIDF